MSTHNIGFDQAILMSTNNIGFYGEISKIIPKLLWFKTLHEFKKDLPVLHKLANDALMVGVAKPQQNRFELLCDKMNNIGFADSENSDQTRPYRSD